MSVMLASDVTVVDYVINKVVQDGDSVHRIGTEEPLEVFQGLVPGNPLLAYVSGRPVTTVEYGLHVSVMCACTCVFAWVGGEASHYQDPAVCSIPAHDHF